MAFPTIATAQGGVQAANATSWTLTWPTGITAGDLLLLFLGIDGNVTVTPAGTGWVATTPFTGSGGACSGHAHKKVADGSETGTFTATVSGSESGGWRIYRISGWEGTLGTTFDNAATTGGVATVRVSGGDSANPNPANLDPLNWATEDTLWIAGCAVDTSRTISVYPLADNNTADVSGGAGGATLGLCTLNDAVSAKDPGTFTISTADQWGAITVAVRPAAGGPATHQGSVTAPFTFDSSEVGRLNPAKASVTAPFTLEPSIAGFARRYGAITTPVTWDAALSGVLKKFGALTTPFTFDATLLTKTTRYGTITAPFTFDSAEAARVTMRSSVTAPWAWTVDSAGFARRFGASDNPYVFGISVDGQVTTGSETIFGALANDLVWTATTNGITFRYGAIDLPLTWTAAEASRVTARTSISSPFAFTISTGHRVTMRAALAEAYLFAIATGQRVTMRASVGEAYLWDVFVNGELAGTLKTGSVTSPFTWTATTNGVRRTYGASDNPFTFGAATAGYTKLYGAVTLPLTFERVVNGIRIRYGSVTLPIVWDSSTSGATSGVITGAVTSPFTFEVASATRLTARGTVALDLTFDTATLARLKLLAALDVPLALAVDTTGIRVVAGATATELVWLASVSGIADVTLLEAIFTGRVGNGSNGDVDISQGRIGDTVAGVAFQEDEVVTGRIA